MSVLYCSPRVVEFLNVISLRLILIVAFLVFSFSLILSIASMNFRQISH